MRDFLIFAGVGIAAYAFLRYSRGGFAIASNLRYSGRVANVTGEARQVSRDIRYITEDVKSVFDTVSGWFDSTNDADEGGGGSFSTIFEDRTWGALGEQEGA